MAGYPGVKITYMLKATGFDEVVKNTTLYSCTMRDNQGMEHHIKALGIEEITNKCLRINQDLRNIQVTLKSLGELVQELVQNLQSPSNATVDSATFQEYPSAS